MADTRLEYAKPSRDGGIEGWLSVGLGLLAWGGILVAMLLPRRPNTPSDLDFVELKIAVGIAVLVGTPIGAVLANISIRKSANSAAVVGLVLNLMPWLLFSLAVVWALIFRN